MIYIDLIEAYRSFNLEEKQEYYEKYKTILKANIDEEYNRINSKLPKVSTTPENTLSSITYTGDMDKQEFQVW